jgi:hypothetical protein
MLPLKLPGVPEILGNNVIVPKQLWETIVNYLEEVRKVVNAQADTLNEVSKKANLAIKNTETLAEALEDLYHENL